MTKVGCPSCRFEIELDAKTIKLGDFLTCIECETMLEIVWLNPIELDFPYGQDVLYEDYDYAE